MDLRQKMFLAIAQEMSITKAAKRLFVTQQCVSIYLKKMEEDYGCTFFNRRPRLSLTAEGKEMLDTLWQIQLIEQRFEQRLEEMQSGVCATIRFGINSTRARIISNNLCRRYNAIYPKVKISFEFRDTRAMENMLAQYQLDLFLGVNTSDNALFVLKPMRTEPIFFVCTEQLLKKSLGTNFDIISSQSLSLKEISKFPMVRNSNDSTLNGLLDKHLLDQGLSLDCAYFMSDYENQFELCRQGIVAAFCPKMMLKRVIDLNFTCSFHQRLLVFDIKDVQDRLNLQLVTHSGIRQPDFINVFIDQLHSELQICENEIDSYKN
ncbi:LysR family transcriptional regulator [Oscillospiraceae bacterium LTW-04]|nr:LysR family transcriptional regulator [Oscillospiraceae bacterium MB24-C1]